MGSGGPRGLQIPRSGVQSVRGGFDSHTFPPFTRAAAGAALIAALLGVGVAAAAGVAPEGGAILTVPDSTSGRGAASGTRAGRAASDLDSAQAARLAAPPRWSDQPRYVMLRSLVLPGWGQVHNRAYVKAGLVAAGEGWLIAGLIADGRDLGRLHQAATDAQSGGDPVQAQIAVNAYNERLNRFVGRQWLFAGVVVYALLDAYVDAHFRNFDIEFRKDPALPGSLSPGTQRLDLRWTF